MQIKNHYKLEKISQKKKISDNHKVMSSSLGVKHFFYENFGEIEARCMGLRQSLASCFWIDWINSLACSYFGRLLSLLDPILVPNFMDIFSILTAWDRRCIPLSFKTFVYQCLFCDLGFAQGIDYSPRPHIPRRKTPLWCFWFAEEKHFLILRRYLLFFCIN